MVIISEAADANADENVNEFSFTFSFFFFLTFLAFFSMFLQYTLNAAHHLNAKAERRLLLSLHS